MRMMPRAAPNAMRDGVRGAGVKRCSYSRSPKNSTEQQ